MFVGLFGCGREPINVVREDGTLDMTPVSIRSTGTGAVSPRTFVVPRAYLSDVDHKGRPRAAEAPVSASFSIVLRWPTFEPFPYELRVANEALPPGIIRAGVLIHQATQNGLLMVRPDDPGIPGATWLSITERPELGLKEWVSKSIVGTGAVRFMPLDTAYVTPIGSPFIISCTAWYQNRSPQQCDVKYALDQRGLALSYYFDASLLPYWREIDSGMRSKISEFSKESR